MTIEPLERRDLLSATPQLLKDINATGDAFVRYIGEFDGFAYLVANDGTHGIEVWKSDGTAPGTTLLKDIRPGALGGGDLTGRGASLGGYFIFSADDGINGRELWRTDGTPEGTTLLKDILPGSEGSRPIDLTVVGSTIFFVATGTAGEELWKTDGTPGGTVLVKDIVPGPGSSFINQMTAVGNTLFFTADDDVHGDELWMSDGSAAGTVLVEDLNQFGSSQPWDLTNFGGTLVFSAEDGFFGHNVWKVDPGVSDITVLKELPNGSFPPSSFYQVGSTLFFVASTNTGGSELWKTDGTDLGTELVLDIQPGSGSSNPATFANVNGILYFFANDGTSGTELWKSDGFAAGTQRVKDIRPGSLGSQDGGVFRDAININGLLMFPANDGTNGPELWRSDGTTAGTVLVKETSVGPLGGYTRLIGTLGGNLLFSALDPHGFQLWKSDGSEPGTQLVKAINSSTDAGSNAQAFTNLNGQAIFLAGDFEHGGEFWTSDGTTAGTQLVKDIYPGTGNAYLNGSRAVVGSVMYFSGTDGTGGVELWRTDGTDAGTYLVKDINPTGSSSPTALTAVGDTLFFTANDGTNGPELWKSDGTPEGTVLMQDLRPGSLGSAPGSLVNLNGTLFFTANDGTSGVEIWKSAGTPGDLTLLKDIRPGSSTSSQVSALTNVGGTLFFAASESSDVELWKSDGTTAGTVLVKGWSDGGPASPSSLTDVDGTLFFVGNGAGSSFELWKSDGSPAGTMLVKDILPGNGTSNPSGLTAVGDSLFFFANDGSSGTELWTSDGSPEGTFRVEDIRPGSSSSIAFFFPGVPAPVAAVGDMFYFPANDGTHGIELWRSDGTPEGTELVADINSGTASSGPARLANVAGSLYFQANDGITGIEPWIIKAQTSPTTLGRYIFYNQSKFDGNSSAINAADDNAIATDKVALQFSGTTTAPLSAFTSYSRGINGIMVDLPDATGFTLADFTFKVGTNSSVASWAAAPAPSAFSIRPGAGVGGSDRIVITWPNNAIQNSWLQVIVEGNDAAGGFNTNTGLQSSDVFFFGNKIGDTFQTSPPSIVSTSAADAIATRNNPGFNLPITNVYDFDRNQIVSAGDEVIARNNGGFLTRNLTWSPPAGPLVDALALVAEDVDAAETQLGGDAANAFAELASAVASALAMQRGQGPAESPAHGAFYSLAEVSSTAVRSVSVVELPIMEWDAPEGRARVVRDTASADSVVRLLEDLLEPSLLG